MLRSTKKHSTYWKNRTIDWKTEYFDTHGHPHRELILRTLVKFRFGSVFEFGCGAGANLLRIHYGFPGVQLGGIDINAEAIKTAQKMLPGAHLQVGTADDVFLSDKSIDIALTDACLIYYGPLRIKKVLAEMKRLTRRHIVLCEFHEPSLYKRLKLHYETGYYAYDYKRLLERAGFFDIEIRKIPAKAWPDTLWEKYGYIINATI